MRNEKTFLFIEPNNLRNCEAPACDGWLVVGMEVLVLKVLPTQTYTLTHVPTTGGKHTYLQNAEPLSLLSLPQ